MTTILVGEDNPVNRELLREILENEGYSVVEASDGEEVLRTLEHAQPHLLLLDIGMPVMDGFAVARRIRENPRRAGLPIVAVTANAMKGDRAKILDSRFDGYLSKPVSSRLLFDELNRLLNKSDIPESSKVRERTSRAGNDAR